MMLKTYGLALSPSISVILLNLVRIVILCFYDVEKITQLEEKIKMPFHYVLMILTVVLAVILAILLKSMIFSNTSIFLISFVLCIKNLASEERDERKWCCYWFMFAMNLFLSCLEVCSHMKYFKFFFFIYIALYDDLMWVNEILEWLYAQSQRLFSMYVEKFCSGETTVVEEEKAKEE